MGTEVRYGAMIKNGYTEAVGGVVLMTSGGNAKEIVSRVKERVAEINRHHMIPGGLQIVPYYDRSQLVDAAIHTVTEVLAEGVLFVVVILYSVSGRPTLQPDRQRKPFAHSAAYLPGHESHWPLRQSDVPWWSGYRDRPDGGWLCCGGRECLRQAKPCKA